MKKELKTLNDIANKSYLSCECNGDYEEGCLNCLRRELKAEAIKWVKYYQADGFEAMLLRKFHNISEEDLKDE